MKKTFLRGFAAACAMTVAGILPAQAADYTFTFAHVLMESTPNGQAALSFKKKLKKNLKAVSRSMFCLRVSWVATLRS